MSRVCVPQRKGVTTLREDVAGGARPSTTLSVAFILNWCDQWGLWLMGEDLVFLGTSRREQSIVFYSL